MFDGGAVENRTDKNPQVYYFNDGLYIHMPAIRPPEDSTETQIFNKYKENKEEEKDQKKKLALNLLNEYKTKKTQQELKPKLNEQAKMDIDNIFARTEKFLKEREVIYSPLNQIHKDD